MAWSLKCRHGWGQEADTSSVTDRPHQRLPPTPPFIGHRVGHVTASPGLPSPDGVAPPVPCHRLSVCFSFSLFLSRRHQPPSLSLSLRPGQSLWTVKRACVRHVRETQVTWHCRRGIMSESGVAFADMSFSRSLSSPHNDQPSYPGNHHRNATRLMVSFASFSRRSSPVSLSHLFSSTFSFTPRPAHRHMPPRRLVRRLERAWQFPSLAVSAPTPQPFHG